MLECFFSICFRNSTFTTANSDWFWPFLEPPNVLDLLGFPKCVGFRFCDTLKNPSHKMQFQMVDPSAWKSVLAFVWLLQAPLLLRLRYLLRLRWRLCHDRRGSSTDPQYTRSSVYVRWSASLKLLYMRLKIYEKQKHKFWLYQDFNVTCCKDIILRIPKICIVRKIETGNVSKSYL